MRTTRNWKAVKTEFVTGDISNVSEFARMKGIPADTINKHSTGWLQEQADHRQNIGDKTEEVDVKKKVVDNQRRKEYLSEVLEGTMAQWSRVREKIIAAETSLEDQPPSQKMLLELNRLQAATTKMMPDLIRCLELLDGGATARTDTIVKGRHTKDMSEEELHAAEEEIAREVLKKGDG